MFMSPFYMEHGHWGVKLPTQSHTVPNEAFEPWFNRQHAFPTISKCSPTRLGGWCYFEKIPKSALRVSLRRNLCRSLLHEWWDCQLTGKLQKVHSQLWQILRLWLPSEIIWDVSEITSTWITPPRDLVSCSAVRHGQIVNLFESLRAMD